MLPHTNFVTSIFRNCGWITASGGRPPAGAGCQSWRLGDATPQGRHQRRSVSARSGRWPTRRRSPSPRPSSRHREADHPGGGDAGVDVLAGCGRIRCTRELGKAVHGTHCWHRLVRHHRSGTAGARSWRERAPGRIAASARDRDCVSRRGMGRAEGTAGSGPTARRRAVNRSSHFRSGNHDRRPGRRWPASSGAQRPVGDGAPRRARRHAGLIEDTPRTAGGRGGRGRRPGDRGHRIDDISGPVRKRSAFSSRPHRCAGWRCHPIQSEPSTCR